MATRSVLEQAENRQQGVAAPVDVPVVRFTSGYLGLPLRSEAEVAEVAAERAVNDLRDQAHLDATHDALARRDLPILDELIRLGNELHDKALRLHRQADGLSDDTGLFCDAISDAIGALRKAADAASGE